MATVGSVPVRSSPSLSSSTVDEGRFLPGVVVAGRYRIASLLGRGGMGEVYRATDLTLGQAVALKFLPEAASRDERALARFYNEVRMARQVTHPNVCRVYDIGEVEGQHYISMEFVDGEDLAALLPRIGRMPPDRAAEVARKMCAGLAAAHEKGVLHRDLKPANVMIDGRGNVLLMDFGLAGLSQQMQGDIRSGTPAYMSPEQLAGTEVTFKSDIYSLGLVIYEIYTGRRAYEASSVMELMQKQERAEPAGISSIVRDLDPAVERTVMRCLDPNPAARPSTALAVAAGLGGDALAAALAAGETPSPGVSRRRRRNRGVASAHGYPMARRRPCGHSVRKLFAGLLEHRFETSAGGFARCTGPAGASDAQELWLCAEAGRYILRLRLQRPVSRLSAHASIRVGRRAGRIQRPAPRRCSTSGIARARVTWSRSMSSTPRARRAIRRSKFQE